MFKWMKKWFKRGQGKKNEKQTFKYAFRQMPWGELIYFTIEAKTQEEADALAKEHVTELFNSGITVMTTFISVKN